METKIKPVNIIHAFLLVLQVKWSNCQPTMELPIVGMEMSSKGFHREITYTVQFDYPFAGRECEYILEQRLPAAVYISVDQLNDLKRLKLLDAIYPKFVDIEAATERALPFSVLLRGVPKITDTITLPIHFRYHAADNSTAFIDVDIGTPTLYMHCLAERNDWLEEELEHLQTTPNSKYCLNLETSSFTLISNMPATTQLYELRNNCHWRIINLQMQLTSEIRAHIPIGNKQLLPFVIYGSIALSWIVAIWLIWCTCSVPCRINQKLKEQRVLEQKIK